MRLFSSTSLTSRIFFASAVLLPLLLGFSGSMLNHAFKRSLQASEREMLRGQVYLLLGAAEPGDHSIVMPPALAEPRYSTVSSGLYGWILDSNDQAVWRSPSMELVPESKLPKFSDSLEPGWEKFYRRKAVNDEAYFTLTYDVVWEINGRDETFRFVVGHSQKPLLTELAAYRKRLLKWLGGLTLLLIMVQTFIARWGLRPLRQLAKDLEHIEDGTKHRLEREYPDDIKPVTENLNKVLQSEQSQRERYRNTLSDLAHSLKTPLSVIRGQLEAEPNKRPGSLSHTVDEQVDRMKSIVDHQLRRATAQVSHTANHSLVDVGRIIGRIVNAVQKVYQQKNIHFDLNIGEGTLFVGDEADLMELAGNLIENACKYGHSQVCVTAAIDQQGLTLKIEDNGPGVSDTIKRTILTRGARADTATTGQGIGLAVAVDILSSYGGSLKIEDSILGGACFNIRLPQDN